MAFVMSCFFTTSCIPATFRAIAADDALKAFCQREYGEIPEVLEVIEAVDVCRAGFVRHLAGINATLANTSAAICTSMDRCFHGTLEESRVRLFGDYLCPMIRSFKLFDEQMDTMAKKINALIVTEADKGNTGISGLAEFARLAATKPEPVVKMEGAAV